MTRKDLVTRYAQLGLIVAAFVLVASIIAAPLLQRVWAPAVTASLTSNEHTVRLPITPIAVKTERRG